MKTVILEIRTGFYDNYLPMRDDPWDRFMSKSMDILCERIVDWDFIDVDLVAKELENRLWSL